MPFTGDGIQLVFFANLKAWAMAASPNAQLLDEAGNIVKTFTLTTDDVVYYQSGSTAIVKVRIIDDSNESYTFKRLQLLGQNPEAPPETAPVEILIDHTFSQNYSKSPDQTLEIYVYTGIQNVL